MNSTETPLKTLLVAITIAILPGCVWGFDEPEPEPEPEPVVEEEEVDRERPTLEDVEVADWPPIGPEGVVTVTVADNEELDRVEFQFAERHTVPVRGRSATVTASGTELGEGIGELDVRVTDAANNSVTRNIVRDLLVDLTPPELTVRSALLGYRDGTLELLVQDDWVLGSVEVTFQGETVTHEFPEAYPSSIGEAWDQSLVKFPASSLPHGSGLATIVVRDAAGNETRESVDLVLDALPPEVEIINMAGDRVEERFQVRVNVTDDHDVIPTATLLLSGTPVGDVVGTSGLIEIDPLDFAAGEHELVATAVDAAGNRGWSQPLSVTLE